MSLTEAILAAAQSAVGQCTVVPGISKPWFTPELRRLRSERGSALRALTSDMPANAPQRQRLARLSAAYHSALVQARRSHVHKRGRECAHLCSTEPGSYRMHRALDKLAHTAARPPLPTLRHPDTDALCIDAAEKAEALRAYTANVASAREAASPEEAALRATARECIAAERTTPTPHGGRLDDVFDHHEVLSALSRLGNHIAADGDGMPAELLKYSGRRTRDVD